MGSEKYPYKARRITPPSLSYSTPPSPFWSLSVSSSPSFLLPSLYSLSLSCTLFWFPSLSPPQGVLDQLANRCLAQGTNAWTDVDHTCYTVMTAGSQGFLNLLPVYLDHVLYPTLTVCIGC